MKTLLIAIDPGVHGAICVLDEAQVTTHKMPETTRDKYDLFAGLNDHALLTGATPICYMERVGGFVKGVKAPGSSMFNFGEGVGELKGILTALKIRWECPMPQVWQRGLNLGNSEKIKANYTPDMTPDQRLKEHKRVDCYNNAVKRNWKRKLKEVAQRLYPQVRVTRDNADALLILEYARRAELGIVVQSTQLKFKNRPAPQPAAGFAILDQPAPAPAAPSDSPGQNYPTTPHGL